MSSTLAALQQRKERLDAELKQVEKQVGFAPRARTSGSLPLQRVTFGHFYSPPSLLLLFFFVFFNFSAGPDARSNG